MKSVVAMVLAAAVSSAAVAQPASAPVPAPAPGPVEPSPAPKAAPIDAALLAPRFTAALTTFVAADFTDSIGDLVRSVVAATAPADEVEGPRD